MHEERLSNIATTQLIVVLFQLTINEQRFVTFYNGIGIF